MFISESDITRFDRIRRLNIINSISGIKAANLIGTVSKDGDTNLAIFSSVIHIGSHPPFLGMIVRPAKSDRRDTYANIRETGYYTINHVPLAYIAPAHYSSAKFGAQESEFKMCGFEEEYIEDFLAPYVRESFVKTGMEFVEEIPIQLNDTVMIIGEVKNIILPEEALSEEGYIDLAKTESAGISGLNTYYKLDKIATFDYARPGAFPQKKNKTKS